MSGSSDEELAESLAETGDSRAFAALVDRWQRPVQRLCTRMLGGDVARAEDLTQEVFVRLFEKRSHYSAKPGAKFSTYLWRVAINRCRDEIRRRERRSENVSPDEFASAEAIEETAPDNVASSNEEAEIVRRALGELPETYRSVLVLRHYEGLRLREIAEVLEIPEGTVYSRMAEALRRMTGLLRAAMEDPVVLAKQKSSSPTTPPGLNPCISTTNASSP